MMKVDPVTCDLDDLLAHMTMNSVKHVGTLQISTLQTRMTHKIVAFFDIILIIIESVIKCCLISCHSLSSFLMFCLSNFIVF